MLTSSVSRSPLLPYQQLPQLAYDAARDSMVNRGYVPEAILDAYTFSAGAEQQIKVNALVFAHPVQRTPAEYASFTVYNAVDGLEDSALVRKLAQSAAPFHIIHRNDRFSFWATNVVENEIRPLQIRSDIPYHQLDAVLRDYENDLKPERVVDVKQGRDYFRHPAFRTLSPLQLSLWVVDVNRNLLREYFAQAVNALREHAEYPHANIPTALAIQLLGATILADTGVLGDNARLEDLSLRQLLQTAHKHFPNYFELELFGTYGGAAERAFRLLRQIRYTGFVPDMLADLYTAAYDRSERKELGRFDTPLYLTRRIWEAIPIEFLPPDQRVVADMTCGWGSFLIAGYERLSRLSDLQDSPLREHLHGNDVNTFTAQLAGLGILISTSQDRWHIDHEDALRWSWLNYNQPNIIVGNPPFKGSRRERFPEAQSRYQKADQFVKRAIDRLAPNGYLAMLVPQSFIAAESSPEIRKQLLSACDVFELWELPLEVFPDARAGTLVIFAQKRPKAASGLSSTPVTVRTVQRHTLKHFGRSGVFTASEVVASQSPLCQNR